MSDDDTTLDAFDRTVNLTAHQLEGWLATRESQEVGQQDDAAGDSTGHEMGRRIVEILGKHRADLTDADVDHMREVVGDVHRHLTQRPDGDVTDSRWRFTLMNWGHDPLR